MEITIAERGSAFKTAQEFLKINYFKETKSIYEFNNLGDGQFEFIDNKGVKYKMRKSGINLYLIKI